LKEKQQELEKEKKTKGSMRVQQARHVTKDSEGTERKSRGKKSEQGGN